MNNEIKDWVLVPREPTPKMVDSTFDDAIETSGDYESHNTRNRRVYAAMIQAAPTPPAEAQVADFWRNRVGNFRYKIGDRVRVTQVDPDDAVTVGMQGTVVDDSLAPWVRFDKPTRNTFPENIEGWEDGHMECLNEDQLELVEAQTDERGRPMTYWGGMAEAQVAGGGDAVEKIAALLYTDATDEPWTVAGVEHDGPDRASYRKLARRVIAALSAQPRPVVMGNDGSSEADFIAHHADACMACGGSGHKADTRPEADSLPRYRVKVADGLTYLAADPEGDLCKYADVHRSAFFAALVAEKSAQPASAPAGVELREAATKLLPCPFCNDPMQDHLGILRHVEQDRCPIGAYAWPIEDAARWNARAALAQQPRPDDVTRLVEEYRPTMDNEALRSWAQDMARALTTAKQEAE